MNARVCEALPQCKCGLGAALSGSLAPSHAPVGPGVVLALSGVGRARVSAPQGLTGQWDTQTEAGGRVLCLRPDVLGRKATRVGRLPHLSRWQFYQDGGALSAGGWGPLRARHLSSRGPPGVLPPRGHRFPFSAAPKALGIQSHLKL